MNDFATLTNAPVEVEIGGRRLQFRQLTWGDFGRIQRWVTDQLPCPIRAVRRFLSTPEGQATPVSQQKSMVNEAIAEAGKVRAPIGSPEATAILEAPDGITFLLYLMARPFHLDLTPEGMAGLLAELPAMEVRRLIEHSGVMMLMGAEGKATPGATPAPNGHAPSTYGASSAAI